MLTKQEAEAFTEFLRRRDFHNLITAEAIFQFTEKPKRLKRQIQVGDIYRDEEGRWREIESESEGSYLFFTSSCGYLYKPDGSYIGEFDMTDLDLSKRYKLVEVDDDASV